MFELGDSSFKDVTERSLRKPYLDENAKYVYCSGMHYVKQAWEW